MKIESDSLNQQLQRGQKETELALVLGKEKRVKRLAGSPGNASCETKRGLCVTTQWSGGWGGRHTAGGGRGAPSRLGHDLRPPTPWLPSGPLPFPGSQCSLYVNNLSMTLILSTRQAPAWVVPEVTFRSEPPQ